LKASNLRINMTGSEISEEWSAASASWANFVREGKDYFREEMNKPGFFTVVGDVKGKRVLDLACGEGSYARILTRMGAKVVGVDLSPKMIELAKQMETVEKLGIEYHVSDAMDLGKFAGDKFDVVTCFMALMGIEYYREAVAEVAKVLKSGRYFIFCITHPRFEGGECLDREPLVHWVYAEGTEGTQGENALHLEITAYFQPRQV